MIAVPARIHLLNRLLEQSADDVALVAEVILEITLADVRAFRDARRRDSRRPVLIKELQGGLQNTQLGGPGGHGHILLKELRLSQLFQLNQCLMASETKVARTRASTRNLLALRTLTRYHHE